MVISIFDFLELFYGEKLDSRTYINHKKAKKKYHLKSCGIKYAKEHLDLIKHRGIVFVSDTYGVVLPYMCPKKDYEKSFETSEKVSLPELTDEEMATIKKVSDSSFVLENIASMPTYEVGELLSEYKYIPSYARIIKRELIARGVYANKIHKLKKKILEIELEEGEFNDKYQRRQKIRCKKP